MSAVLDDAAFVLGPAVERFERQFADYLQVAHCVAVNSGTSALHLALLGCGVGPGDEVITTPHTWVSTAWAISYTVLVPRSSISIRTRTRWILNLRPCARTPAHPGDSAGASVRPVR